MALYVFPPMGSCQLHQLTFGARKRMEFLLKVANCNGSTVMMRDLVQEDAVVADADCLIDGSKKDTISHFVLRLACCQNSQMQDFFLRAELLLFRYRISCMRSAELNILVRPLRKLWRVMDCSSDHGFCDDDDRLWLLQNEEMSPWLHHVIRLSYFMTRQYSWRTLIEAYEDGSIPLTMVIPFYLVTDQVAKRSVELRAGQAYVPTSKLCDLLTSIFKNLLQHGIAVAKRHFSVAVEDPRMKALFHSLKALYSRSMRTGCTGQGVIHLLSEDVDRNVHAFPLCMSHLHHRLRKQHRLQHFDRIRYTLFLKELGMPVNEALHFWRSEYSQPSDFNEHIWHKDSRRYTYNIRHLYGLEGARHNYRGHSCHSIQSRDVSPCQEGGCPFKHFDYDHLKSKLQSESILGGGQEDILMLSMIGEYNSACLKFLVLKLKQSLHKSAKLKALLNIPDKHDCFGEDLDGNDKSATEHESSYFEDDSGISSIKAPRTSSGKDDFIPRVSTCPCENVHQERLGVVPQHSAGAGDMCPCDGEHITNDSVRSEYSILLDRNQSTHAPHQPLSDGFCHDSAPNAVKVLHDNYAVHTIRIHRPVDYFQTYSKLLEGLR